MRILGIDPGLAIVGYSVIDIIKDKNILVSSGSIQTDKDKTDAERLLEIENDMQTIIEKFQPDFASIEKLFYFKNQKTIIPVAEARGVILSVLQKNQIKIQEFTPIEVKQIITGYGRATKDEVAKIVQMSIEYKKLPKLDDTLDSIAIALCLARNNIN
ncbi:TPA: crossover junction endodeoxyribonuclease RuvC [Candidatus Avigastranaerophilus faecigallinarum]|nr:crossover junction endodeoxyribonuclease RuvC [Candidatus Avigastranaerophilus faecigallinarum]